MKSLMERLAGKFKDARVLIAVGPAILAAGGALAVLLYTTFAWWPQGAHGYLGLGGTQGEALLYMAALAGALTAVVDLLTGKRGRAARLFRPQLVPAPVPVPVPVTMPAGRNASHSPRENLEVRATR